MIKAIGVFVTLLMLFKPALGQTFTISGTMMHTNLEGGCWYVEDVNGKHYELLGDSATVMPLREEGKGVTLVVEPAKGAASICMVGDIVRVVQVIQPRRGPYDPPYGDIRVDGTIKQMPDGTWYVISSRHAKYEFQQVPKKLQHVGKRVHQTFHIILDPRNTKHHMDGLILADVKPHKHTKFPQKKYDPR